MLAMSEKEHEAQPGGEEGANAGESEATREGGGAGSYGLC